MADGIFPSVISKDRDDNVIGNPLFFQMSGGVEIIEVNADGSINIGSIIPGVGASDLGKAEDAAHATGDTGVQLLAVRNDTLASLVDTDGDYASLQVDADGALYVTGTFSTTSAEVIIDDAAFTPEVSSVAMVGFFVDEVSTDLLDEGDGGAARIDALRRQLVVLVDSTTDANRITIDNNGEIAVNLPSNTELNPVFVQVVTTGLSGGEIHDFDQGVAIASDTTDNHDYTVVNTTFLLKSVILSGSGNIKAEIQSGPIASLVTHAVVFLTGKEGDTQQVFFDPAIEVPVASTGTVRVIRTNRQGSATDVYTTIIGNDV